MKVLVVGLDGATLDLLGPWIAAGELPTLRRLLRQGAWGRLRSTLPPVSSSSWNSFITGLNPGKHGVVDFVHPGANSYKVAMADSTTRRARAMWNWLNDAGLKVGLLGIPVTYPPEPVDGFMVSGFLAPGPRSAWAYPPELKPELLRELGEFQLAPRERYRSTRRLDRFLEDLTASVENRTQAALYLMRTRPWDLFTVVYWDTDMVQHETWRLLDPGHPRYDASEAARYREPILAFHRKVDADLGRLLAAAGSDALTIVMSDHGFGPVHSFFLTNVWLAMGGWLRFRRGAWPRIKRLLFSLGYTPLHTFRLAKALGLGRLRKQVRFQRRASWVNRAFLSFDDVEWSRTQAFSMGSFGQVYINKAGVYREGIVQPGAEYDALRDELTRDALNLRDPLTGLPLVERVYRREEIYHGPYVDVTPDLMLQPRGWEYMAFGHADFGSNRMVEAISGLSGHHRPDGLVIVAGPGVKADTQLQDARILDLLPTILHVMEVDVPKELDGRVLLEAFAEDSQMSRPVRYCDANVYRDASVQPGFTEEESQELQQKLRGWGYAG